MGYFSNLLVQDAIWKSTDGTDSNGVPVIVSEKEIKCRIEFSDSVVVAFDGQEKTVSGRIFTEAVLKPSDILYFDGRGYTVVKVTPSFALDGVNAVNEVYFQ